MDFLTKELIKVAGLSIALWHVIAAVAGVVLLIIVIVALCRGGRKSKQAKTATQTDATTTEPTAGPTDTAIEPTTEPVVDQVVEPTVAETPTEQSTVAPAEAPTEEPVDQVVEPTVDEPTDQVEPTETAMETPAEAPATPKKPTVKNYHISLRPDGKWQVKLSKGGKAIKLFNTQAEAIAFAKARAKSQDGHITIHKVDGRIRKQKY